MTSSRLRTAATLILWYAAALAASWLLLSGFWHMTSFWSSQRPETATRGQVEVYVAVALLVACTAWAASRGARLAAWLCATPVALVALVGASTDQRDGYQLLLLPVLWLLLAGAGAALAVSVAGDS